MYDTPGIDSNITHDFIFKKVQEIQSQKNNKNNFILYCITDQHRFNSIDGELIQKIMKLYPFNDLPVIIVILQAYFRTKTNKMKEETKKTLLEFLSKEIADKIEIKDIIAKDMEDHKAKGIPDLLKTAFEIKGKRIYSEKLNNFTQEMNEFKKKNIDTKLNIIKEIISENIYPVENIKNNYSCVVDFFDNTKNNFQNLENIFFNEINEENFETKLKEIFNVIYQKINDETENEEFNNFIKEKLNEIKKILEKFSDYLLNLIYSLNVQKYFYSLQVEQSDLNDYWKTNLQINNFSKIEDEFKFQFFNYFNKYFYQIFFWGILKLFYDNLKEIVNENFNEKIEQNKIIKNKNDLEKNVKLLNDELIILMKKYFPELKS